MKSIPKYKVNKIIANAVIMISTASYGVIMHSCSTEEEENLTNYSEYLSLSKSNFDFVRDWENLSETDKDAFRLAKKRINITFEKNGICQTKWTSNSQVNISEDLFNWFIHMINITNQATEELNKIKWPPIDIRPRLRSGDEASRTDNFDNSNNNITYYDPQNNCYGQCDPNKVIHMYSASYFNHY